MTTLIHYQTATRGNPNNPFLPADSAATGIYEMSPSRAEDSVPIMYPKFMAGLQENILWLSDDGLQAWKIGTLEQPDLSSPEDQMHMRNWQMVMFNHYQKWAIEVVQSIPFDAPETISEEDADSLVTYETPDISIPFLRGDAVLGGKFEHTAEEKRFLLGFYTDVGLLDRWLHWAKLTRISPLKFSMAIKFKRQEERNQYLDQLKTIRAIDVRYWQGAGITRTVIRDTTGFEDLLE